MSRPNVDLHPSSLCASPNVGAGTKIGPFSCVAEGVIVGLNCRIGQGVSLESGVTLGDGVEIGNGVQIPAGVHIQDGVSVGANAVFLKSPLLQDAPAPVALAAVETLIAEGASIGANATILPGVTIGVSARVEAGAVVKGSIPPNAIVSGNPAHIVGYGRGVGALATTQGAASREPRIIKTQVANVTLHEFPLIRDLRGDLSVGEFLRDIPFTPKRYFLVFDVPNQKIRGEHAHRKCHQFLVCVRGSCSIITNDGKRSQEFVLDRPSLGVHVPARTWSTQYKYSADAVLLVFASEYYDAQDYIRDYGQFLSEMGVPEIPPPAPGRGLPPEPHPNAERVN